MHRLTGGTCVEGASVAGPRYRPHLLLLRRPACRRGPLGPRMRDRGSVLMLYPAAVVIILLLGAIVVDSAIVYLAQRQAHNVALDAANDAAGAGLDAGAFRQGAVQIDPDRARAYAVETVLAAGAESVDLIDVIVGSDGEVTVTVRYRVERLFGQAFGLGDTTEVISATAAGEDGTGD